MPKLSKDKFRDVATAVLNAWDAGRLKNMIAHISQVDELDASKVLEIMGEAEVLTALSMAESVKAKAEIIKGLERRIAGRELENPIRDYIAKHPWLLSPRWQTYRVESRVDNIVREAAEAENLDNDPDWKKRIDLALSGGNTLLIVEFMRPKLKVDRDHIQRFEYYVTRIRESVMANSALQFSFIEGLLVADKLTKDIVALRVLERLRKDGMEAIEWPTLLEIAKAQWKEYLDVLIERAPSDERLAELSDNGDTSK